jgi:hypothetical protein
VTGDTPPGPSAEVPSNDPVAAVKADIEETRAELQETVDELSDRLNPKVQAHRAAESLSETAKRAATETGSAAHQGAAQARTVAQRQLSRARGAGRARQLGLAVVVLAVIGVAWWRRGRR